MSIFKTGYFVLLPKELIEDLSEYALETFSSFIILETTKTRDLLATDLHDDNITYDVEKNTYLLFNILIEISEDYANDDPTFPFEINLQQLQVFLDYSKSFYSAYEFITRKQLIIPAKLIPNIDEEFIKLAKVGVLKNLEENNCINLHHDGSYIAFTYFSLAGRINLYSLTRMQSEVLLYKLIKFYNDLVTGNIRNIEPEY